MLVTRAPGRLDVMGGIADYSGSLVLQMPIAEACHVALQRQPVGKQKVWKHVQVCDAGLPGEPCGGRLCLKILVVACLCAATATATAVKHTACCLQGLAPACSVPLRSCCWCVCVSAGAS